MEEGKSGEAGKVDLPSWQEPGDITKNLPVLCTVFCTETAQRGEITRGGRGGGGCLDC